MKQIALITSIIISSPAVKSERETEFTDQKGLKQNSSASILCQVDVLTTIRSQIKLGSIKHTLKSISKIAILVCRKMGGKTCKSVTRRGHFVSSFLEY